MKNREWNSMEEQGSSLWKDAFLRLSRNRAAMCSLLALALIVAAGLAVAFAPYSVQQGMVLLFFDPARTWAAVGASVLGALVVCGAVQAASWLILRRICVK